MLLAFLFACGNSSPDIGPATDKSTPSQAITKITEETPAEDTDQPPAIPSYKEGETITISGTAIYSGDITGKIIMEVLQNSEDAAFPKLMQQQTLSQIGPFEITVPKDTSDLTLMIYIDATGDQVTDDDPKGYYSFHSAADNINDIKVNLFDKQDLYKMKDQEAKKEEDK